MRRAALCSLVLTITAALIPCGARTPGAPLKPGFNTFNKQQDVQLGQEAAQKVLQQSQVVQNKFLQDYVNRIGQRLAGAPEARDSGFHFTFTVINDPSVNAFALPGGPMFIHTGLLKDVDNEAQLAGVMGHEMSHVILRHGTNQASKANLIQLPAMLAGLVGGHSMLGQLAALGVGLGANSVLLKFSRTDESEADALGSHLMSEAGFNPIEMARFFEKLQTSGGGRGPQFLSDHPNPGNREKAIEEEVRTLPVRQYGYETGDFQKMKQELATVPSGRSGQGQFRGATTAPASGQPTGGMKELRGQSFSLSYPANWQAYGGNNSDSVTIAPQNGIVQGASQSAAVGYGAIVSYYFPDNNRATDLSAATEDLIHHLTAQNNGMQIAGNSKRVRVANHDGLVTMMQSGSPYGGTESDALLTVATPQGLFYMVFIAPQNQFGQLQGTFDQMVQSIRFAS
ncbi:MAG: M48 family metallopeptidase [Acidobacteriota bacterium]|nr:M48 family metallopeptidase [Acidobacteriota bacterium]